MGAGWYDDVYDATRWRWWDGQAWTEHYAPKSPSSHPEGWRDSPEDPCCFWRWWDGSGWGDDYHPKRLGRAIKLASRPLRISVTFRMPASTRALEQHPGHLTLDPVSRKVEVLDADEETVFSAATEQILFGWAGPQFRISSGGKTVQIDFMQRPKTNIVIGSPSFYTGKFIEETTGQFRQDGYAEFTESLARLGGRWGKPSSGKDRRTQMALLVAFISSIPIALVMGLLTLSTNIIAFHIVGITYFAVSLAAALLYRITHLSVLGGSPRGIVHMIGLPATALDPTPWTSSRNGTHLLYPDPVHHARRKQSGV